MADTCKPTPFVRVGCESATATVIVEALRLSISEAPEGDRPAVASKFLLRLAEQTGDARLTHAARYIDGSASPGAPLKPVDGIDEATRLVERGASIEHAARTTAERLGGDPKTRRNTRERLMRRLKKRP